MLANTTSHCPLCHPLSIKNEGVRYSQERHDKFVKENPNFQDLYVCDVCTEPFEPDEELMMCSDCNWGACWRCFTIGREAYVADFILNVSHYDHEPFEFKPDGVINTDMFTGLLTSRKDQVKVQEGEDSVTVSTGALEHLDFDFNLVSWGQGPSEKKCVESAAATFDVEFGYLRSIELEYSNKNVEQDLELYEFAVVDFSINKTKPDPADLPYEMEVDNWFVLHVIERTYDKHSENPLEPKDLRMELMGHLEFSRLEMETIPGFRDPPEKASLTSFIKEIAIHKRQTIDKMSRNPRGRKLFWEEQSTLYMCGLMKSLNPNAIVASEKRARERRETAVRKEYFDSLRSRGIAPGGAITEEELWPVASTDEYPGLHRFNLIYSARLSLLAYLTEPTDFDKFFPAQRERYLLDPVCTKFIERFESDTQVRSVIRTFLGITDKSQQELQNNADQLFLTEFIAAFFVQDQKSAKFGQSRPLVDTLADLNLDLLEVMTLKSLIPGLGSQQCFIAVNKDFDENGGDIAIVFQGTNDLSDHLLNFHLVGATTPFEPLLDSYTIAGSCGCLQGRLPLPGLGREGNDMRVHNGFYQTFLGFRDGLEQHLRDLLKRAPPSSNTKLVVTGHSLGGALATLCTAWLMQLMDPSHPDNENPLVCEKDSGHAFGVLSISYGSPKVGNMAFADFMEDHHFVKQQRFLVTRVFDLQDPVVTLPPNMDVDYCHVKGFTIFEDGKSHTSSARWKELHSADKGVKQLLGGDEHGYQSHDIFLYMYKALHTAWMKKADQSFEEKLTSQDQDTQFEQEQTGVKNFRTNNAFWNLFGGYKGRYHEFTQTAEFVSTFGGGGTWSAE